MIIKRTYRFNPTSLWQEFRCEFEDGSSADDYLNARAVAALRASGVFVCFGKY